MHTCTYTRGRNNSNISGSQQDYLVVKSGSPQIYVVVIWPRFKQNNMTNTKFDKYSQYFWQSIGLLLSSSLVVRPSFWQSSDYRTTTISIPDVHAQRPKKHARLYSATCNERSQVNDDTTPRLPTDLAASLRTTPPAAHAFSISLFYYFTIQFSRRQSRVTAAACSITAMPCRYGRLKALIGINTSVCAVHKRSQTAMKWRH